MARPRKPWSATTGEYGKSLRIFEPKAGAPLRWDYREGGERKRPDVMPLMRVRTSPTSPVDVVLEKQAVALLEQKHAEMTLAPVVKVSRTIDAATLTVAQAYALYNDPKRKALPKSRSAMQHHSAGRAFWEKALGVETLWNDIPPADVEGPLLTLIEAQQVETAVKRLQTLRTMTRWLQRKMRIRGLEDPTIGIEASELKAGYAPNQPRLTPEQVKSLRDVLPTLDWRSRLYYTLLIPSGTRAVQARSAMRSMLDAPQQPPIPSGFAPFGWIALGAVKGQTPHLTYFTEQQRAAVDAALAGPLARFEAKYQAREIDDYPLIPGGRIDRDELTMEPVSDRILRYDMGWVFRAAGIPKEVGDGMGFHAIRRAWSDLMDDAMGTEGAAAAGGWTDDRMLKGTYRSKLRHKHLEQARKVQEGEDQ